jgi:ribosomal 50S subunit-recycling heat shock protein
VNDILEIRFGNRVGRYRIVEVKEVVRKEGAADMYEVLEEDAATKAERGAEE